MLVNSNNDHQPNCEFAEETVSYLYGELSEPQKAEFRTHLENCSACAGEVQNFASLQSSIRKWKAEEFDRLSTPAIEIPYHTAEKTFGSFSWFDGLWNSFSRGFVPVGALAALVVGLVLGSFFLFSSADNDYVAGTNKVPEVNKTNTVNVPVNNLKENIPSNDLQTGENDLVEKEKPRLAKSEETKSPAAQNNSTGKKINPVKASANSAANRNQTEKAVTPEVKNPKTDKNKNLPVYGNVPRLNNLPEEAEDDDLRLADLLDEIDAD